MTFAKAEWNILKSVVRASDAALGTIFFPQKD